MQFKVGDLVELIADDDYFRVKAGDIAEVVSICSCDSKGRSCSISIKWLESSGYGSDRILARKFKLHEASPSEEEKSRFELISEEY